MNTALNILLTYLISMAMVSILLIWYIIVMKAIKKWGKRNNYVVVFGILPFAVFDFICNMTVVTLLTLDLPRELLVTRRLDRYRSLIDKGYYNLNQVDRARMLAADQICDELLDPYDTITGDHC